MRAAIIGFVLGLAVAISGVAGAAWLVTSEKAEVSVKLASLSALKVGTATTSDDAFPGKTIGLVAEVENENPVTLEIVSSSMSDLRSGVEACDAGLGEVSFLDSNGIEIEPGKKVVVLGRLVLPGKLPGSCQGQTLTAAIVAKAAYGS